MGDDVVSQQPHTLVSGIEERWSRLESEFGRAYWDSQVNATPETESLRNELELELRRVEGDPDTLAAVRAAGEGELHDPVLRRQLEILDLTLTGNQMQEPLRARLVEVSSSVESDFASHRPEVNGKRLSANDVDEILRSSDDVDLRERAWGASKEIGALVSERVRELARIRNEVARHLGFADYFSFSLHLQEIDEEWLFSLLGELERGTDEPYSRYKDALDEKLRRRFRTETLRPWHYSDPFFQQLPSDGRIDLDPLLSEASATALAERTFELWGIDLDRVLEASDLYPRERKSQHAFCIDTDRAGDVRILANIVPGERWIEVMLHESGHAAYDVCIDHGLPYLLRSPAHTFVTEAIALMSGRLVRDPRWLAGVAGISRDEVAKMAGDLEAATAAQGLVFARWGLAVVHFERELYADPEADLHSLWWDNVERFQRVSCPPDRNAPDWAAKVHIAAVPVYYQNYLLGELLATQLERACEQATGGLVGERLAGDFFVERVFSKGAGTRWDALIEEATQRPLSADDHVRSLG